MYVYDEEHDILKQKLPLYKSKMNKMGVRCCPLLENVIKLSL
jgi:hypothetical protein